MKYFTIVFIAALFLSACDEQKGMPQQQATQQKHDQDLEKVLIQPYTKPIPLIGDGKMKTKNWVQKTPDK